MSKIEVKSIFVVALYMLLTIGIPTFSWAEAVVIVQETFERKDWSTPVGTAPNVVNLPGGVWTKAAGYATFNPQVPYAGWASTETRMLIMGSGGTGTSGKCNVGLAIPLMGYRSTSISVDVKLLWSNNTTTYGSLALGFYGESIPEADTEGVGYLTGFTGVAASRNGTLTLYEKGVAGSSVATGVNMSWGSPRTLSYEIDPDTGTIFNIMWVGSSVEGLNSTAFVRSATLHAAAVAFDLPGGYSQTLVDNFVVQGVVDVPSPKGTFIMIQ